MTVSLSDATFSNQLGKRSTSTNTSIPWYVWALVLIISGLWMIILPVFLLVMANDYLNKRKNKS